MGIEWEGKAVVANIVCAILSFSHGTYCHGFYRFRDGVFAVAVRRSRMRDSALPVFGLDMG